MESRSGQRRLQADEEVNRPVKAPDGFEPPQKAVPAFPFPTWVRRHFQITKRARKSNTAPIQLPSSERRGARRAGWSLTNHVVRALTTPALRATPPVSGGELLFPRFKKTECPNFRQCCNLASFRLGYAFNRPCRRFRPVCAGRYSCLADLFFPTIRKSAGLFS